MTERHFYEIDERTGSAHPLAYWQGGTAPCGGPVVYAPSCRRAADMYRAYKYDHGIIADIHSPLGRALVSMGSVVVDGEVWNNVIH